MWTIFTFVLIAAFSIYRNITAQCILSIFYSPTESERLLVTSLPSHQPWVSSTVSGKVYGPRAFGRGDSAPRRASSMVGLLTAAMVVLTAEMAKAQTPLG